MGLLKGLDNVVHILRVTGRFIATPPNSDRVRRFSHNPFRVIMNASREQTPRRRAESDSSQWQTAIPATNVDIMGRYTGRVRSAQVSHATTNTKDWNASYLHDSVYYTASHRSSHCFFHHVNEALSQVAIPSRIIQTSTLFSADTFPNVFVRTFRLTASRQHLWKLH